jgi:hypothetical protein
MRLPTARSVKSQKRAKKSQKTPKKKQPQGLPKGHMYFAGGRTRQALGRNA